MPMRSFPSGGIRRATSEDLAFARFILGTPGTLALDDSCLSFNDWCVPYANIESAVLRTYYGAFLPQHHLLVSDGTYNYLFVIPRREVGITLPFPSRREVMGRWVSVLLWVSVGIVVVNAVRLLLRHLISSG